MTEKDLEQELIDTDHRIHPKRVGRGLSKSPYYLPLREGEKPDPSHWETLTRSQQAFILAFVELRNVDKACDKAGISRKTYQHTWSTQTPFRETFNYYQRHVVELIRAGAVMEGVKTFRNVLDLRDQKEDQRVSLQASRMLLEMMERPTLTKESSEGVSNPFLVLAREVVIPAVEAMQEGRNPMENYEPPQFDKPEFYDTIEDQEALDELERRAEVRGRAGEKSEDVIEGRILKDVEPKAPKTG